jgi:subtilisin family serine protease
MKLLIAILFLFPISIYAQNIVTDKFIFPKGMNSKLYSHQLINSINQKLATNPNEKEHFIFIYFTNKPAQDEEHQLTNLGVSLYPKTFVPQIGNHPYCFLLAKLPIDSIESVLKLDFVKMIADAEQKLYPQNNLAAKISKIDSIQNIGYAGEQVKIAFLDSGLDLGYKSDELTPNIIAIDYSAYPDSIDLDVYNKVTGHGTHVVGSAMAKGVLSSKNQINGGGSYKGPANKSGIVFLKIGDDKTASCTIKSMQGAVIDAVADLGANVVSLSYASMDLYNDGSSAMEQSIDWVAGNGVPVFCCAGNSRHANDHYSGELTSGGLSPYIQIDLNQIVYSAKPSINLVWTNLENDDDLDITYYDANKQPVNDIIKYQTTTSPRATGSLVSNSLMENSRGMINFFVRVENKSNSSRKYHLYLYNRSQSANTEYSEFAEPDTLYSLLWPSTADSAFCVGSYVTRNSWISSSGKEVINPEKLGSISSFSGCGPRIDGLQKPDILAPGENIISLLDRSVYHIPNDRWVDNDGTPNGPANYYIMKGTSMSTPVVAGVAAQILSRSPQAKPHNIYRALRETASQDSITGEEINFLSGWGKLDAYQAINSFHIPDILTVKPDRTIICGNEPFKVTINGNSDFTEDNVFNIQLSDADGKFINPITIAIGKPDINNKIECSLSNQLQSSDKYRIRALSSFPQITSAINDKNISISDIPTPKIQGNSICCNSILYTYTTQEKEFIKNVWTVEGGVITKEENNSINVMWVSKQAGLVRLESENTLTHCKTLTTMPIRLRISPSADVVGDIVVCNEPSYKYSVGIRPGENTFWSVYGGKIVDSASNFVAIKWLDVDKCGFTTIVTDDTCNVTKDYEVMNLPAKVNGIMGETNVIQNCVYEYTTTLSGKVYDYWTINGGIILDSMTGKISVRWLRPGNVSLKLARHTQSCSFEHTKELIVEDKFGSVLNGKFQVCENEIEEYAVSNQDTAEYKWEISAGKIIENKGDTILVLWNKAGNGNIKLIKSKEFRNYLDTLSQNISILKKPVATLNQLPNFCKDAPPYQLSEGNPIGGYYSGSGITNNIFNPALVEPGKISVKYIYFENPNCKDTVEGFINVYPTPQTPELIRRNDTLIALGSELYYNWYRDDVIISEYAENSYFPLTNGVYSTASVNSDSCISDLSNAILVNNTDIIDNNKESLFELSPNPAKDFIALKSFSLGSGNYSIINMQGKTLITGVLLAQTSKIDISSLESGIYIFRLTIDNNSNQRKIFIKI